MRRIDTATKAVDLFGAGKHGFKDGDPALAILATKLNAAFFNSIQEEVANLIEASGQTLNGADNTQLLQALQILRETLLTKSVAGGVNVTLTDAESRHTVIRLTGVLTANINVIVPAAGRPWVIANNTTGAFTVTVKTAAGSGVVITQATAAQLYCDGTNVLQPAVTIPDASTSVKGKVQLATLAEAIAGIDALKALTSAGLEASRPSRSQCTAWVNFNGAGALAIRDSFNVSSITDNGVGDYTVNFATPMNNSNYSEALSAGTAAGSNLFSYPAVTKTTTQLRLRVSTVSPVLFDGDFVSATFFGGK